MRGQLGADLVDVDPTLGVDVEPDHLGALVLAQPVDRVQDGVVLDARGQHPPARRVLAPCATTTAP